MGNSKPRILFILDYYTPHIGGLEVVFDNLITRLLAQGYHIGIITSKHMNTLPSFEEEGNLRIWRVGHGRNSLLRYGLRKGLRIVSEYDIIHTTTYAGALPASLTGRIKKKKVIITIHEVFGNLWYKFKRRGRLFKMFERLLFQFPYTTYVCVSKYTQNMVHRLYGIKHSKLHLIYNGVDATIWSPKHADPAVVDNFRKMHQLEDKCVGIYYGHSGMSKGIDDLIQAIPEIVKEIPDFHAILNIIPTKRDYKILEMINELGLNNHILLLHGLQQQQLVNIVSAADFAIVPSVSEGFGLVAAEVSQLNKPLIVTRNGALPEVVCGKVIFLEHTDPASIIQAINKVRNEQRENIPHKSFERDETISKYEELYIS